MEAQHHHSPIRPNGPIFDKGSRRATGPHIAHPEWRRYGMMPAAVPNPSARLQSGPGGIRNTGKSLEVRDDVYVPPPSAQTGGLAEVTNRLDSGSRRQWSAHRYESHSAKHFTTNAYAPRFPSAARLAHDRDPSRVAAAAAARAGAYHANYWRDREELARRNYARQEGLAVKHYTSQRRAHSPRVASPPFADRKTAARLAHYSAMRALENQKQEVRHLELENSRMHDARRDNSIKSGSTSSPEMMDTNSYKKPAVHSPKAIVEPSQKRSHAINDGRYGAHETVAKKPKSCMLDLLCSATLELGPIQDYPSTGCSCPRSNCIKLYCDCFKAGTPCSGNCSCINCKNTEAETRVDGERIRAIKNTLARNPRAFTGGKKEAVPQNPGDVVCNCLKSRCLKLYCNCFHKGRTCNEACLCISCLNTTAESNVGGRRNQAIQNCLEKRPDAFTKKPKEIGSGCACKNNKCLKKYW